MAKKKAPSKSKKSTDEPAKVTRIKATDTRSAKKEKADKKPAKVTKVEAAEAAKPKKSTSKKKNPLKALGGYFKGAWQELRQVRWPNRRTTWGLTLAVIAFTAFFIALIVLLDFAFQLLFDEVLLAR